MLRCCAALFMTATLVACTDFPELDRVASAEARTPGYPSLVPFDTLLSRGGGAEISQAQIDTLQARAAGLKARAAALRGPVLSQDTRARLIAAVARRG